MNTRELAIRQRLKDDLPHYAAKCLRVRPKSGDIAPFHLNSAQEFLHSRLEEQLRLTGKVRALVLKARQWGCSTYVGGRFFWKTTHRPGIRAFILTHRDQATDNLFGMVKRFYDNCPALVRPELRASNAKELDFGKLDSGYRVGTAKATGVGRSDTIQLFHGSEVALWANAEDHARGALQAVPREDDTEVILESTALGIGGLFHSMCKAAQRGESEYQLIFVPWFMVEEYRTEPPSDWSAPLEFQEYGALHGVDNAQLHWAWLVNSDLAASAGLPPTAICWQFRQEYPATAEEAFQSSGGESFIPPELVLKARKWTAPDQTAFPLVFGCDFARGNRDFNYFISRQARVMGRVLNERFHSEDTMEIAGRLARLIDKHRPVMSFLDTGGNGAGVFDRLREQGYSRVLRLVNFGERANDARRYANKRAEMNGLLRDWLADTGGADLPDDDALQGEICAAGFKHNSNQQIVLEAKEDIRKRIGISPDGGDAAALTFAEPVRPDSWAQKGSIAMKVEIPIFDAN